MQMNFGAAKVKHLLHLHADFISFKNYSLHDSQRTNLKDFRDAHKCVCVWTAVCQNEISIE